MSPEEKGNVGIPSCNRRRLWCLTVSRPQRYLGMYYNICLSFCMTVLLSLFVSNIYRVSDSIWHRLWYSHCAKVNEMNLFSSPGQGSHLTGNSAVYLLWSRSTNGYLAWAVVYMFIQARAWCRHQSLWPMLPRETRWLVLPLVVSAGFFFSFYFYIILTMTFYLD